MVVVDVVWDEATVLAIEVETEVVVELTVPVVDDVATVVELTKTLDVEDEPVEAVVVEDPFT